MRPFEYHVCWVAYKEQTQERLAAPEITDYVVEIDAHDPNWTDCLSGAALPNLLAASGARRAIGLAGRRSSNMAPTGEGNSSPSQ